MALFYFRKVVVMKKTALFLMLLLILLVGCGRSPRYRNAAGHLGDPRTVQILVPDEHPVTINNRTQITQLMTLLNDVEVRKLTVEEEIDLVLVQGVTLMATEVRFRDNQKNTFKAFLLPDGALMVAEGAVGENAERRDLFLSEPNQQTLINEISRLAVQD
jgi:hypothetical protein